MPAVSALFSLAIMLVAGCQSAPRPLSGMATLTVRVAAQPKMGFRTPAQDDYGGTGGSSGGSSASARLGAFAAVDYSRVSDIVIIVEPHDAPPPASADLPPVTIALQDDDKTGNAGRGAAYAVAAGGDSVGRVFAATVGARIRVVNAGRDALTIYSLSPGNEFDLGSISAGESADAAIRAPGLIEILSESRELPVGWVFAANSPWIQCTNSRSNVVFANLPPGQFRVSCWHPRLPASSSTIRLEPDTTTRVELKLGVDQLDPDPGAN